MPPVAANCLQIRGFVVDSYALLDEAGRDVTLIDGGFFGNSIGRIEQELEQADRTLEDIRAILITHGHLDHTLHIARLQELTGAPVFAPAGDELHIAGQFPYRGISRFCGFAEAIGRTVLKFRSPKIDQWFRGGDLLDFWGGLRVIHLPGHTPGHCGFYSEKRKLLFAGDLFANFFRFARCPPPWFNVDSKQNPKSLQIANELDLSGGVLLNHCHAGTPLEHRDDLRKLAEQFSSAQN